jgi:hypothetical protein
MVANEISPAAAATMFWGSVRVLTMPMARP